MVGGIARVRFVAAFIATPILVPACFEDEPIAPGPLIAAAVANGTNPFSGASGNAAFSMRISCDVHDVPDGKGGRVKVGIPQSVDEVCASPDHNMDRVGNTSMTDLSTNPGPPYAAGICPKDIAQILRDSGMTEVPRDGYDTNSNGFESKGGYATGALSGLCLEVTSGGRSTVVRAVDALQPGQDCITESGRMHLDLHACSLQELGFNEPQDGVKSDNGGQYPYLDDSKWQVSPCPTTHAPSVVVRTSSDRIFELGLRDTRFPVRRVELLDSAGNVVDSADVTPNGTFRLAPDATQQQGLRLHMIDGSTEVVDVPVQSSVPRDCDFETQCPSDAPSQHPSGMVVSASCELDIPGSRSDDVGSNDGSGGNGSGGNGSGSGLSTTTCDDKPDGWWCMEGTAAGDDPWMAYCEGRQIKGGCLCSACKSTGPGSKATCTSALPPEACTSA